MKRYRTHPFPFLPFDAAGNGSLKLTEPNGASKFKFISITGEAQMGFMKLRLRFKANRTEESDGDEIYVSIGNRLSPLFGSHRVNFNHPLEIKNGQTKSMTIFEDYVGEQSRGRHRDLSVSIFDKDDPGFPLYDDHDWLGSIRTEARLLGNRIEVRWSEGADTHLTSSASALSADFVMTGDGTDYELNARWEPSTVRKITNKHSNKCLDVVNESKERGANVQQWQCKPIRGNDFVENQRWFLQYRHYTTLRHPSTPSDDDALYHIVHIWSLHANHSGDVLDVEGGLGNKDESRNVQQFPFHNDTNQVWYVFPSKDNDFFYILDRKLRALDVADGSVDDNANVQVHPFHGGDNQKWAIDPAPSMFSMRNTSGEEFVREFIDAIS